MLDCKIKQWFWLNFIFQLVIFYALIGQGRAEDTTVIGSVIMKLSLIIFVCVPFTAPKINVKTSYVMSSLLAALAVVYFVIPAFSIVISLVFIIIAALNVYVFNYSALGVKFAEWASYYFVFEMFLFMILTLLFIFDMDGLGVWLALPATCMLGSIICLYCYRDRMYPGNKIR